VMSWSWGVEFFFKASFIFLLSITSEEGGWELGSITDGEATAWDSRACAPDAISIGIALTFFTMSSFALISSLSANFSDVVVEFFDGLWRSNLNNWSLLLLIAGEDSSWELGGIINSKATAWDSGASAPDTGWVGIAFAFFTVVSFALFGGFSTSQYSHELVGRHLILMLSHSLFMMLMHLLFSDMMNTMALVKGKET